MGARRKIFHNGFAGASPVFTVRPFHTSASQCAVKNLPRILHLLGLLLLCGVPSFAGEGAGTANTTVRRQAASGQFARAEEQRAALNAKAPNKRSLAEYKQVVSTYHRVYLITPHA